MWLMKTLLTSGCTNQRGAGQGKPTQNGFIESFNGRFRDECLNEHWFSDIVHARKIINDWRQDYNECRPHSTLNYQTPSEFAAGWRKGHSENEDSDVTN